MILSLKNQEVQNRAESPFQKNNLLLEFCNSTVLLAHENQVDILLETVFWGIEFQFVVTEQYEHKQASSLAFYNA